MIGEFILIALWILLPIVGVLYVALVMAVDHQAFYGKPRPKTLKDYFEVIKEIFRGDE